MVGGWAFAWLQVHPGGLRHIRPDRRINEWKVPGRRTINKATSNERQVRARSRRRPAPPLTPPALKHFESPQPPR